MALSDAIGGQPDFSADSVLDRVSRAVLPDLPDNVNADTVLNRLNRKLAIIKSGANPADDEGDDEEKSAKAATKNGKPDFSSEGTPVGDLPDLSSYGTPADAVPLPQPRPPSAPPPVPIPSTLQSVHNAINPMTAAKGAASGLVNSAGGIVQGLGTIAATGLGRQAPEGNEFAANPVPTDAAGNIATSSEAVAASPVVKAGQAIKSVAPDLTPEESNTVLGKVSQMGGAILPYALMTAVNPLAGMGAGAVGMAADTYGNVYEQAKKAGADDTTAQSAASKSALVAGVLGSLPLGAGKYAQSLIGKVAASSAAFATAGEAQEAILQQIAKDYDPKAGYTLDQKRLIAELILGAGMGGLHHAAEAKPGEATAEQPPPTAAAAPPEAGLPPPGEEQPASAQSTGTPPPGPDTGASGAGAQGGPQPGPDTGGPGAGNASTESNQGPQPGPEPSKPPPGTGEGKGADFAFATPDLRAKMERLYRLFTGNDPSNLADHELYNAVNESMRDTSSTGYTAKPETPEEATARESTAKRRDEDEILRKAGWSDPHINAMTPEQRADYLARAPAKPEASAQPETPGTREAPIRPAAAADVVKAQAAEPTPAQAIADNYRQAHIELPHLGLSGKNGISIETGVGQTRKGVDADGKPWETTLEHGAYGKIRGTTGADGDHLDIFVGPHPQSPHVFVLDQIDPKTGKFDEHKVLAGYRTPIDALHGYANSYNDLAKARVGGMTAMTPDQFKDWIRNGDHTKPLMSGQKLDVGTAVASPAAPNEAPAATGREATGTPSKTSTPANGSSEPLSLLQFVASKGGIAPHPELNALDLNGAHRVQLPGRKGFFGVVRPSGEPLDRMREAAEEAGYLRGEGQKTSTIRDFLDAIDNELRGQRKAAEGEELAKTKRDQQLESERAEHDAARDEADYGEARRNIADAGYTDLPADLYNAAAKLVADEGMDPDSAVERAAARLVTEDSLYPVTDDDFDTTYGKGASDAIQARAASEDGEPASRSRAERARPGEGQKDRANGTGVPAAGPPRSQDEIAAHRDAIEAALGPDANRVSQVDIASAAEMMADHPDMDVAAAFGRAVIENAVRQKFITQLEAAKAYGKEVEGILVPGSEGAHSSGAHAVEGSAEPRQERAGGSGETGLVPSSGKTGSSAETTENPAAAEVQNKPADDTSGENANAERAAGGEAVAAETRRQAAEGHAAKPEESEPRVEKGADGKDQIILPGAEKAGQGDLAQRAANAPLKPKVNQKPADVGLFSDEKDQMDLLAEPREQFGRGAEGQQHVLAEGRRTGNEHLVAYDADGNLLESNEGSGKFVGISDKLLAMLLKPDGDVVIHHNHPSGTSLSPQDVIMLGLPGQRAVWAHGHNGNVYRGELTPEFKSRLPLDPNQMAGYMKRLITRAETGIKKAIEEAIDRGEVEIDAANDSFPHLSNLILRLAGVLKYKTNFDSGDFMKHVPGLYQAMEDAAINTRLEAFSVHPVRDTSDGRTRPVRHAGDVGAVFDRGQIAAPVNAPSGIAPARPEDHSRETRREDKGVGGTQPRLLEGEQGFASPGSIFTKRTASNNRVSNKIANLFSDSKRADMHEVLADYSYREKLLQKEIEARYLGLTPEEAAKIFPEASKLPDAMQFYIKKGLISGKIVDDSTKFKKQYLDPLVKAANEARISREDIGDYLLAKGAQERNRNISQLYKPGHPFNDAMRDNTIPGGSGFSNKEASDKIREYEAGPNGDAFKDIWKRTRDIVNFNREMMVHFGLETRDTIEDWKRNGKDYIPYSGFEETPEENPEEYFGNSKYSALGIQGPETKRAFGRKSKADNPLVHLIDQTYRTIERGERNTHYNSIWDAFATLEKSGINLKDIVSVNKGTPQKTIDAKTGLVKMTDGGRGAQEKGAVNFKRNGIPRTMLFKSEKVAQSILRNSPWTFWGLRHMLLGINRLKAMWTHYSPDFAARHFLGRYMIEGVLNAQQLKDTGKFSSLKWIADATPQVGRASRAIVKRNKGVDAGQLGKYWDEMKSQGGQMAFRQMRDINNIKNELTRDLRDLTGKTNLNPLQVLHRITGKIDEIFNTWDNATRLATYAQARDQGMTAQAAAHRSLNATVNYQKAGLIANVAGTLFPFFKVSVNTGTRMAGAMAQSKRMRGVFAGVFFAGVGLSLVNYLLGGNDEDGTPFFEKVPPWERALGAVFINPIDKDAKGRPQKYIDPMPYNYALPMTWGYHLTGMLLSKLGYIKSSIPTSEHLTDMVKSALMAFSPLGETGNLTDMITPELLKPFAHVANNKDWKGSSIHNDSQFQKGPASENGRDSTGEGWKAAAKGLNSLTGGTPYSSGFLDAYPESIRELADQMFGSQKRFGMEVGSTASSIYHGETPKPTETPITRVFRGIDYDQADSVAYSKARREAKEEKGAIDKARKDIKSGVNTDEARQFIQDHREVMTESKIFDHAAKQMSHLRKQQDTINNSTAPYDDKKAALDGVRQQMMDVQNRARAASKQLKEGGSTSAPAPVLDTASSRPRIIINTKDFHNHPDT